MILRTDGLNNPPPEVRGTAAEVHFRDVARKMQGMPWFVWHIQLWPQIDAGVDKAFRDAGFQNYQPVKTAGKQLAEVRAKISKQMEMEKVRRAAQEDEARRAAEDAAERQAEEMSRRQREEAERRAARRRSQPSDGHGSRAVWES